MTSWFCISVKMLRYYLLELNRLFKFIPFLYLKSKLNEHKFYCLKSMYVFPVIKRTHALSRVHKQPWLTRAFWWKDSTRVWGHISMSQGDATAFVEPRLGLCLCMNIWFGKIATSSCYRKAIQINVCYRRNKSEEVFAKINLVRGINKV